jgi:Protein of unknown function (DUF3037)
MPDQASFDYAIVRVVPLVERGEFLNAGIILFCRTRRYLRAAVELDVERLRALAPWLDTEELLAHLDVIPRIAAGEPDAGPMAKLPQAGRFHWLVAPRSTVVQISPVHTGLAEDPDEAVEDLMNRLVRSREQG